MEADFDTWMLVFLRVSAFLLMLPFFSMSNFPVTLRVAVAAIIALLLTPVVPVYQMEKLGLISVLGVMAQEVSVGILLGFVARMIFYAADIAGSVISTEMGLNLASILNPLTQESSPLAGTILTFLATLIMFTLNLHHWMLLGLARTYNVLPIGGAHLNASLLQNIVGQTNAVFLTALQISAPVMAVSFIITLVFAVLSRAVPEMNVFTEMYGFKIVGTLIVLGFTMQLAAQYVANYLNRLPDDLLVVAQMLGGK
jgi:flagellar biosynthetic protein FliR